MWSIVITHTSINRLGYGLLLYLFFHLTPSVPSPALILQNDFQQKFKNKCEEVSCLQQMPAPGTSEAAAEGSYG